MQDLLSDQHCNVPYFNEGSHAPHLDIHDAPIGYYLHCANFISANRNEAVKLLSKIKDIGAIDLQVAFNILSMCGAFCKLVHLARSTPPSLVFDPLTGFDVEVRECFVFFFVLDLTDSACLKYDGLGLRSVALHSCAAYITSVGATGCAIEGNHHLTRAIDAFNTLVPPQDTVTLDSIVSSPVHQKNLSSCIDLKSIGCFLSSQQSPPSFCIGAPCFFMAYCGTYSGVRYAPGPK